MSQQGLRQASLRAATGRGSENLTYNGDWHAYWGLIGIPLGTFDERMLKWINTALSANYTNVNDAMAAYAVANGAPSFGALGTLSFGPVVPDNIILREDLTPLLREDGTYFIREQ